MADGNELQVTSDPAGKLSDTQLAIDLGTMFAMPPKSLINLISTQVSAVPQGSPPATGVELAYVMSVMRQYELNPTLRQVHAWRDDRGKLAVMVGYDGWVKYARDRKTYLGISYKMGPIVESPDGKGKKC